MLCKKPYTIGIKIFGCTQCLPCRINRQRLWSHRMLLESYKHSKNAFVTLTYSDDFIPEGSTLVPSDTQKWLKRLRKAVSPTAFRYYLVGEYGDRTERPHYHAAIFGLGIEDSELINSTWSRGHTYTGDLTKDSAAYIAGYVTKKMTSKNDPRLKGRHPEFARMSLRPGIGATAISDIADTFTTDIGCEQLINMGDVPGVLQHGPKKQPLGRYLKGKLREFLTGSKETPEISRLKWAAELQEMHKELKKKPENTSKSFAAMLVSENEAKALQLETRHKLYKKKGDL